MSSNIPSEVIALPLHPVLDLLHQARGRFTQKQLGKHLDVTAKTVARWESGETPCPQLVEAALKNLLNNDFSSPPFPAAFLANIGFTPINVTLSDLRPMVRAELKAIDAKLPKGGDAITAAHYTDLHLRIKEALNPTRPIVNLPALPGGRSVTQDLPIDENMEPSGYR